MTSPAFLMISDGLNPEGLSYQHACRSCYFFVAVLKRVTDGTPKAESAAHNVEPPIRNKQS
jgi:hypothetical protein